LRFGIRLHVIKTRILEFTKKKPEIAPRCECCLNLEDEEILLVFASGLLS